MSLYSALRAGVSGLFAQSQSMAMISDNIANVNTNGYRLARASFNSLVTQGSSSTGSYVAGSVRASANRQITVNGSVTSSQNPLDTSIAGNGFFAVSDSVGRPETGSGDLYYRPTGDILYTRNGEFRRDANGNLSNQSGYYLLGWPVTGTNAAGEATFNRTNLPSTLSAITVSSTSGRPSATRNLTINANLDRELLSNGEDYSVTANIFDRQGGTHQMRLNFEPVTVTTGATPAGGGNPATYNGLWVDANANGVIDAGEPQEPYAFQVTAQFAGTDAPQFRNGTSTTTTPMYAAFDSVGNFKYFLQPGVNAGGSVFGDVAVGNINANDGTYNAAGAPGNNQLTRGLLPPLPPANSTVANLDSFLVDANLSDRNTGEQERIYDTGAVTVTAGAAPTVNYVSQGASTNRPDWRIVGTENGNVLDYDLDGDNNNDVTTSTSLVLDIDAARDSFSFNGSPPGSNFNPVYENDFQLRLEFGATGNQNGLTLYQSPSVITDISQDGRTVGQLEGVQIDEEGFVNAVYDNGQQSAIAQVPVVGFNAADRLDVVDRNAFRENRESGISVVRYPGTANSGRLAPSTVEASNVDVATEFTDMIVAQRAYSANTKIITTADEMLDELIRAKR